LAEQCWQALLQRFDGVAMTVEEFCRREGLTRSSFFLWRLRLPTDPKRTPAPVSTNSAALAPKPLFVERTTVFHSASGGLDVAAAPEPNPLQMHLGQMLNDSAVLPEQPQAASTVPAHTRRKSHRDFADEVRDAPFFDAAVVPVQTIEVPNPEAQGLAPEQYEVVGEKVSHWLAQRPDSFVVLKYVWPVFLNVDFCDGQYAEGRQAANRATLFTRNG